MVRLQYKQIMKCVVFGLPKFSTLYHYPRFQLAMQVKGMDYG